MPARLPGLQENRDQPNDENLETRTARTISTPQRHLSQTTLCQDAAQLARSSGFPIPLAPRLGVTWGRTIADVDTSGDDEEGWVGGDGGAGVGSSKAVRSGLLSPMFGRLRGSGVQYCGNNGE
jgi:hypothetical protein